MYIPSGFAEHREEEMFSFIEAHPFGALITAADAQLFATHLPFLLERGRGAHGTLQGHLARANPHHRITSVTAEAMVIFTGPDAYISPGFYASKAIHGKVVPTWNYVAVHAYGAVRFVSDAAFLRDHLERLTLRHEEDQARPWSLSDAPDGYVDHLLDACTQPRSRARGHERSRPRGNDACSWRACSSGLGNECVVMG